MKDTENSDVLAGRVHADINEAVDIPEEADGDAGVPREWHSRGYLPHRNSPQIIQAISYRLADSLPRQKLELLETELAQIPDVRREARRRRRIEEWLDAGMGCCALRNSEVASYVENSFKHFHGDRYLLVAWCIMPNHVHVLIEPRSDLRTIVQGWKAYTARWILSQNERLDLQIPNLKHFWMRDYWDRYIRNLDHCQKVIAYIHQNPVKANLCRSPEEWSWSSAHCKNAAFLESFTSHNADEDVSVPRGPSVI